MWARVDSSIEHFKTCNGEINNVCRHVRLSSQNLSSLSIELGVVVSKATNCENDDQCILDDTTMKQ